MIALERDVAGATAFLQDKTGPRTYELGIILGSGFSNLVDLLDTELIIPYEEIPHFPKTNVIGHSGKLHFGKIGSKSTMIMQGRFHFYEGHPMATLALPVRVMREMGVQILILTNAAGSINEAFVPGDLMIIEDHLNLSFANPLAASDHVKFGVQFPDTSRAYPTELIDIAHETARSLNLTLQQGVYVFTTGPNYETPAEIRMMRKLGGDAVGMSTFPEALTACHAGIKIFGLSMISNYGSGMSDQSLNHDEVVATMENIKHKVSGFFQNFIAKI